MKRRGNCYVTAEALYHLLGGASKGWRVMRLRHEGDTHWYLEHWVTIGFGWEEEMTVRVDPTVSQFGASRSSGPNQGHFTLLQGVVNELKLW